MAVAIRAKYLGGKRVELEHLASGSIIQTDAPKDNQGQGALFSPTDLVAAGLGACILTTMAIILEKEGIKLEPACIDLEKHMQDAPRRIARIPVKLRLPSSIAIEQRARVTEVAQSCPVQRSLHPDINLAISISFDL